MQVTSTSNSDLEIFLSALGDYLRRVGASVTLDLYVDEPISEQEPRTLFEEMRGAILTASAEKESRDLLMGVPLDLRSADARRQFSLLGHRTIGCEAYVNDKLVFTSIENEKTLWLDLPEGTVDELLSRAHQDGAVELRAV
ncbi:hypothetical protein [Streptomyces sp. AC555_RSS877]|uniref:hypothetical protein n=1 Tax=Streptomyces sp. AC555_RSS877 TaxID=2823688 RepID=UPI001C253D5C|nr:hypothetical protein [Streptomyces sp. AC555_RSS877]